MANLYLTEFANLGLNGNAPIPQEPPVTSQKVAFTTAAQSAAFDEQTRFVRLLPDADCHVAFGANPTATAAFERMMSGVEYFRGVKAGHKVSVYDGSS